MNSVQNKNVNDNFTEYLKINKQNNQLTLFFESIIMSGEWGQLERENQQKMIKAIKKLATHDLSPSTFNVTCQTKAILPGQILKTFYNIDKECINDQNLPSLMDIADKFGSYQLGERCLSILNEKLFGSHATMSGVSFGYNNFNVRSYRVLSINYLLTDEINDDQFNNYLEKLKSFQIEIHFIVDATRGVIDEDKLNGYLEKLKSFQTEIRFIVDTFDQGSRFIDLYSEYITELQIDQCTNIPKDIEKLTHLRNLDILHACEVKFPEEIKNLTKIEQIKLGYARYHIFPKEICQLENLKKVWIESSSIDKFPDEIKDLKNLSTFRVDKKSINDQNLPSLIDIADKFDSYQLGKKCLSILSKKLFGSHATVSGVSFGYDDSGIRSYKILNITYLLADGEIDEGQLNDYIEKLKSFQIEIHLIVDTFDDGRRFIDLYSEYITEFQIDHCKNIPKDIEKLTHLRNLDILHACEVKFPEEIKNLTKIEQIKLGFARYRVFPKEICQLENLKTLWIESSSIYQFPEEIKNLKSLETLMYEELCFVPLPLGLPALSNLSIPNSYVISVFNKLKFLSECKNQKQFNSFFKELFSVIIENKNLEKQFYEFLLTIDLQDDFNIEACCHLYRYIKNNSHEKIDFNKKYLELKKEIESMCSGGKLDSSILELYLKEKKEVFSIEFLEKFFMTVAGQKTLIKNKDLVFSHFPLISRFISFIFPSTEDANVDFYPIRIEGAFDEFDELEYDGYRKRNLLEFSHDDLEKLLHDEGFKIVNIKCLRKHLTHPRSYIDLLSKLAFAAKILCLTSVDAKLAVKFENEKGIDGGGLTKDFFTEFFNSVSLNEMLNRPISKLKNDKLKFLGPIFTYLLRNQIVTGEVFHDSFFRGMVQFSYPQICSEFDELSHDAIHTLLGSGYSTKEENERIKTLLAILHWDGSKEEGYRTIVDFVKFYQKSGKYLEMGLSEELVKLIDQDNVKEASPLVGKKRRRDERGNSSSIKFKKKFIEDTISQPSKSRELFNDSLDSIQTYLEKPDALQALKESVSSLLEEYKNQLRNLHTILQAMDISEQEWVQALGISKSDWELDFSESDLSEYDWSQDVPIDHDWIQNVLTIENDTSESSDQDVLIPEENIEGIDWNQWDHYEYKSQAAEFLKKSIQGTFDKESAISKIQFLDIKEDVAQHFKNWFLSADDFKLKKFLRVATGTPTNPQHTITIHIDRKECKLYSNSCCYIVHFPPVATQEDVEVCMDLVNDGLVFNEN